MRTLIALILVGFMPLAHAACGTALSCTEDGACGLKYVCWDDQPLSLEPVQVPYKHDCKQHRGTDGTIIIVCQESL